jgi:hypothetical protein
MNLFNHATKARNVRSPRVQFTMRQIMAVVAGSAVLIWVAMITPVFLAFVIDDTFYAATKKITKKWDAGPAPKVSVDVFAGYINVIQSEDGQVSAVVTTSTTWKISQASADAAVKGIAISAVHEEDTIRICSTNPSNMLGLRTDVELRVPPGASIELVTGHGYVHIGQCLGGPNGNAWTSSPVALESVKARDSGRVYTGIEAEFLTSASSAATVLDLESRCGSISIKGDNLLVKAKADRGGIEHTGRLAPGLHSFETGRLPSGIRLVVPPEMPFEVDAVATRGNILCDFTLTSAEPGEPSILRRTVGADPKVKLELKSVGWPIEIRRDLINTSMPGAGAR